MLSQAVGSSLSMAMAIALSPIPIIAIVLILSGRSGTRNGGLFAVGWIVGLTILSALVAVVFQGADDPESTSSFIADLGRVVVGAALIVTAVRKWLKRPRRDEEVELPGWMASLGDMSPVRVLGFGVVLAGANPKHLALVASAVTAMVETGVEERDLWVAVAVFVLICSITVIGSVVAQAVGGEPARAFLDGVRRFMVANSTVMIVIVLLVIGANILGDGIVALGR